MAAHQVVVGIVEKPQEPLRVLNGDFEAVPGVRGSQAGGAVTPCPCSLCFPAVMEASRDARLNLLFDLGAHGAFGDVEIVTGLKIDPELRRRPEIAPQA